MEEIKAEERKKLNIYLVETSEMKCPVELEKMQLT